ncbi:hypothetical protein MINTM008_04790 [Mycobacterium intracellulare]|nr:hypothetical protein MINTM008_04790 [Mycobacterium intracellulare]BCO76695.1 hypothetical protein MINTM009_04770 [Mycobacterium intracellulare]BCP40385.1 hypothetical protein MINTMi27_04780 [Mycobacterium intracellulare]
MVTTDVVVRFLAYTVLRYGEMAALSVGDLDMLRRRGNVRQSVVEVAGKLVWSTPKNHERRSAPFPRFLSEDIARRMAGKPETMWCSPRPAAGYYGSRRAALGSSTWSWRSCRV